MNIYNKIVNPKTNRKVNIESDTGKKILYNYLKISDKLNNIYGGLPKKQNMKIQIKNILSNEDNSWIDLLNLFDINGPTINSMLLKTYKEFVNESINKYNTTNLLIDNKTSIQVKFFPRIQFKYLDNIYEFKVILINNDISEPKNLKKKKNSVLFTDLNKDHLLLDSKEEPISDEYLKTSENRYSGLVESKELNEEENRKT